MRSQSKLLASFLAAILLFTLAPTASAADGIGNFKRVNTYLNGQFNDVKSTDWFNKNVGQAYEFGLMLGNGKTFNPNGDITIAESIVLACKIFSIYHADNEQFIQGSPWFQVYVDYALKNNIIDYGFTDYMLSASRADFVQILAKALPPNELDAINTVDDGAIPDIPLDVPYASDVYMLYRAGILTGNDNQGTFTPDSHIQRSSVASIVTRMADRTLRKSISLYAPFDIPCEYFDKISTGNNVSISKITAQRVQDDCVFTFNYTAKYAKTNYSLFNPPWGEVFMELGIIEAKNHVFSIKISISKLKQVYDTNAPNIGLNFYNNDVKETYGLNIQPLTQLWN